MRKYVRSFPHKCDVVTITILCSWKSNPLPAYVSVMLTILHVKYVSDCINKTTRYTYNPTGDQSSRYSVIFVYKENKKVRRFTMV